MCVCVCVVLVYVCVYVYWMYRIDEGRRRKRILKKVQPECFMFGGEEWWVVGGGWDKQQ